MFDGPASWLYTIVTMIGYFLTLMSIYVILTRSSIEMKLYKYCLLKLALCDLLFSLSLSLLLRPEILFPLPGCAVNGLLAQYGSTGAKIALCITVTAGMTIFTAINDCCYTRLLIIFEKTKQLKFIFSWKGFATVIAVNFAFSCVVVPSILFSLCTEEEFIISAAETGRLFILEPFLGTSPLLGVQLQFLKVLPMATTIGGGLVVLHACNFTASFLTLKKLATVRKHMSNTTYKQHRQLTVLLICQNLYPVIAISVPCILLGSSALFSLEVISNSEIVKHAASMAVTMYPSVSAVCSFYFVRPYREYLRRRLRLLPGMKKFIKHEVSFSLQTRSTIVE